jgi:hypothetical protein
VLAAGQLNNLPAGFARMPSVGEAVVELAPMAGLPMESLPSLEVNWFGPARAALSAGALPELRLVANDKVFTVSARAAWRFWRARRPWLTSLAKA